MHGDPVLVAMALGPSGTRLAVVLGLLFGSFANVCIYRWPPTDEFPDGRSVVLPASHCFVCKKDIAWYDNVPLLSYVWLRGRCRNCKTAFSARYLFVEAGTGMLFGAAWWMAMHLGPYGASLNIQLLRFAIEAAFVFVMMIVIFIDIDHGLILDKLTYPSAVIFYGAGLLLPETRWSDGLIGAAVGAGGLWLFGQVGRLIAKREAMGLGDVKLLAVVGALLGWRGIVATLVLGSWIGTIIVLGWLIVRKVRGQTGPLGDGRYGEQAGDHEGEADVVDESSVGPTHLGQLAIPFGPFLATGALLYMFAGSWMIGHVWWLRFMR